jgi:hypothetical protein
MRSHTVKLCIPILLLFAGAGAQTIHNGVEYLPPPDPGYRLYFHDDDSPLVKPERWGYHDGWLQGRLDRSEGQQHDPKTEADYIKGQLHGTSGALLESQYLRVYRSAYLRGYEHGYRI